MKSKYRVLFLFQSENNWLGLQNLFELMLESELFDPVIIKVPTSQVGDFSNLPESTYLDVQKIDCIDGRDSNALTNSDFDAAIYSLPYDNVRPEHLRAVALKKSIPHLFYIPYALDIDMGYLDNKTYRYQHDIYQLASAIFARSQYVKNDIVEYNPNLASKVYITGLPRFDLLNQINDFQVDPLLLEQIGGRKAILWNTHHSIGLHGTATFGQIGINLIKYALDRDFALIWRPHPGFFSTVKNYGLLKNYEIIYLKFELSKLGIILDERPDFRHSFKASDALVSDGGSFVYDYLFTQKPMLVQISKTYNRLASNEAKALLSNLPTAEDFNQTVQFIDDVISESNQLPQYPINQFLCGIDGNASQAILAIITNRLQGGE